MLGWPNPDSGPGHTPSIVGPKPPVRTPAAAVEKFVAFPLIGNLFDGEKADGAASLFLALYKAFDERKATYAQGTIQLISDAETADKIAHLADPWAECHDPRPVVAISLEGGTLLRLTLG